MSPTLNGSSALERFKHSNAIAICNGMMFDFYPGLPHMVFNCRQSPREQKTRRRPSLHRWQQTTRKNYLEQRLSQDGLSNTFLLYIYLKLYIAMSRNGKVIHFVYWFIGLKPYYRLPCCGFMVKSTLPTLGNTANYNHSILCNHDTVHTPRMECQSLECDHLEDMLCTVQVST